MALVMSSRRRAAVCRWAFHSSFLAALRVASFPLPLSARCLTCWYSCYAVMTFSASGLNVADQRNFVYHFLLGGGGHASIAHWISMLLRRSVIIPAGSYCIVSISTPSLSSVFLRYYTWSTLSHLMDGARFFVGLLLSMVVWSKFMWMVADTGSCKLRFNCSCWFTCIIAMLSLAFLWTKWSRHDQLCPLKWWYVGTSGIAWGICSWFACRML